MLEDNKRLVRRYYQAALGNMSGIEEIVSAGFVDHHFPPGIAAGPAGVRSFFQDILSRIFSDMRIDIAFLLAEADRVDCHFALTARHTGAFAEIAPKGNLIRCPAISTFRIQDGKLEEAWEIFDSGDLLNQMRK
ncbi:MAG: ester cyclase [Pirellulaceae bacterium]